jgi:tRNA modification GTPase
VEVHSHGGISAIRLVLEALAAAGATVADQEAWAHASGGSRLAAEAALALARAPTVRSAERLLAQCQGAFEQSVRQIEEAIKSDRAFALSSLDSLLARASFGLRLVCGWKVVLAGRPNVGKSRLLNALAGFDRAIVAATPGTTRDIVTIQTAIDGWPVELADTAGLREPGDLIEASGVALARERQAQADLVLLVLDGSEPLTSADTELLASHADALRVVNKADLPAAWSPPERGWIIVSAERGDGLSSLLAAIAARLVPLAPAPTAALPFLPRHVRLLAHARDWLERDQTEAASLALERLMHSKPRDTGTMTRGRLCRAQRHPDPC